MTELNRLRKEIKEKFRNRKAVFAGWNSFYHPSIAEIFAKIGLDFIGIDIEHSTISFEGARNIMASCQGLDVLCLPRIASHSMVEIKRLLDAGGDGIIAPMVNTPEETKQLIEWIKYPPKGKRSFGVARAQGYGLDYDDYVKNWNDSSIFIVQIESIQSVENVEKILSFEDVDGAMIGPYDISGSLGVPGQIDHPNVVEACKKVIAACDKQGKSCGTQIVEASSKNITDALDSGFTFVVLSSDLFLMWKWAENIRQILTGFKGKRQ